MENRQFNLIKSPNDDREYRAIQLDNRVLAVLIHDKECDKSAAAMNVNVGCLEDPIQRQGLAHFLEHMLFQGTEKYPQVDEYMAYLSKNSGLYNAYTDLMETNFFFQCSNGAFEKGLDMFSQFFVSPLFEKESVNKEINAVNSEHQKNLQQDMWRWYQIFRHISKKDNAMNKFGTGDSTTLTHDTIRDDLLKFYNTYYSANLMKLVIYSNLDLNTLENYARTKFSAVKNNNFDRVIYNDLPHDSSNSGVLMKYFPVNDEDKIQFLWFEDYAEKYYKSNPLKYVMSLIGHEGENSLLSLLKDEGLALELSAYPWSQMKLYTILVCEITLTKAGLENYKKVINHVFSYVKMLKEKGVQQWYFEEIQAVNNLKFQNLDKQKGMGYVLSLGSKLQTYQTEDILQVDYMNEEFKPDLIKQFINNLTPQNLRIMIKSKSVENECNLEEPIYKSKYSMEPFDKSIFEMFENPQPPTGKCKLDLPPRNEFIAKNLKMFNNNYSSLPLYPKKIFEDQACEIYFKQDNQFKTPKGFITLNIYTNDNDTLLKTNIKNNLLSKLWFELFNESINELKYQASEAYLDSSFSNNDTFYQLIVRGFNDSMEKYIDVFVKKLINFDINQHKELFENKKTQMVQQLENFLLLPPYQQALSYSDVLLQTCGSFDPVLQAEQLKQIQEFSEIQAFDNNQLQNLRFEWLFIGNFTEQISKDIAFSTQKQFFDHKKSKIIPKNQVPQIGLYNLLKNRTIYWERNLQEKETNSVLVVLFQHERVTLESKILLEIAGIFVQEPLFSDLRTKQQLGYIVHARHVENRSVGAIQVFLQSDVKSPNYLAQRLDVFLQERFAYWEQVSDEEFNTIKNSVKVNIMEKDTSLTQEGMRYVVELQKHRYQFDRKQLLLSKIDSITKKDAQQFLQELFLKSAKRLEIHLVSKNREVENSELKLQRQTWQPNFKQSLSLDLGELKLSTYPDFNAFL